MRGSAAPEKSTPSIFSGVQLWPQVLVAESVVAPVCATQEQFCVGCASHSAFACSTSSLTPGTWTAELTVAVPPAA